MKKIKAKFVFADWKELINMEFDDIDGLSKIKRSIDSTDYSIGVYRVNDGVYRVNDLKLKCENSKGTFENTSEEIETIIEREWRSWVLEPMGNNGF